MSDKQLTALTDSGALSTADLLYVSKGGNSRKATLQRVIDLIKANRLLYSSGASVDAAANTTEQTLKTYTLAAGAVAADGDMVRVKASGKLGATTRARTIKLYIGSYTVTFTTSNASNLAWEIEVEHIRTASGTKMSRFKFRTGPNGTSGDLNFQSGTINDSLDWTIANDIKLTGQTASGAVAADTNCNSLTVEYLPAP